MKSDTVQDVFFIAGLTAIGGGIYLEFGPAWALMTVGFILSALSIYGNRKT